jgi:lysozyme
MNIAYAIQIATDFLAQPSIEGLAKVLPDGSIQAYWDSKGEVWTIGYGNTYYEDGTPVQQGDIISRSRAKSLLQFIVAQKEQAIRPYVTANLNENQYAALLSLAYNCGEGAEERSTLLQLINSGASGDDIAAQYEKTCITAKGQYVSDLYNRRVSEVGLFFSNVKQMAISNPTVTLVAGGLVFALAIYFTIRAARQKAA